MTDQQINQTIHDHLGLPRTATRWGFTINGTVEIGPYDTQRAAANARIAMGSQGMGAAGPVGSFECTDCVKDYCNDRDAMAGVIRNAAKADFRFMPWFVTELLPHYAHSEQDCPPDEVVGAMCGPCRDLAEAFIRTINRPTS